MDVTEGPGPPIPGRSVLNSGARKLECDSAPARARTLSAHALLHRDPVRDHSPTGSAPSPPCALFLRRPDRAPNPCSCAMTAYSQTSRSSTGSPTPWSVPTRAIRSWPCMLPRSPPGICAWVNRRASTRRRQSHGGPDRRWDPRPDHAARPQILARPFALCVQWQPFYVQKM